MTMILNIMKIRDMLSSTRKKIPSLPD